MTTYDDIRFRPRWRVMATVEVDNDCADLDEILADISYDSRVEPTELPSPESRWFHLVVNASRGENRSAMTAYALLTALQAIAEDGGIPGFRVVGGGHWLDSVPSH